MEGRERGSQVWQVHRSLNFGVNISRFHLQLILLLSRRGTILVWLLLLSLTFETLKE